MRYELCGTEYHIFSSQTVHKAPLQGDEIAAISHGALLVSLLLSEVSSTSILCI